MENMWKLTIVSIMVLYRLPRLSVTLILLRNGSYGFNMKALNDVSPPENLSIMKFPPSDVTPSS